MRIILALLLLSGVSVATLHATTYSCRDKDGKLHITDNLQALPEECRERMKIIDPEKTDNLNFVPPTPEPPGAGAAFDQSVREADRERQKKRLQIESFMLRAKQLADQYRQAEQAKRREKRSWNYGSREVIRKADEQLQQARDGKQQLLQELKGQRIPSEDEQKIRSLLGEIPVQ